MDLERVLQQLRDSQINAAVQTLFDAGLRVWISDEINGITAENGVRGRRLDRSRKAGRISAPCR